MDSKVCPRCQGSGTQETWDEDYGTQTDNCAACCGKGLMSDYSFARDVFDDVFGPIPPKRPEKLAYGAYRTFKQWFIAEVEPTIEARLKKFNVKHE